MTYRHVPDWHGVCTGCDQIIPLVRGGRIRAHGPRGQRCPGGRLPGKNWFEARHLPDWEQMSDLDRGAALMHVWKIGWEQDDAYARDHYPVEYRDDPVLVGLDRKMACRHAQYVTGGWQGAQDRWGTDEVWRLYYLAADHEPHLPGGGAR